jgi:hypothetical protein
MRDRFDARLSYWEYVQQTYTLQRFNRRQRTLGKASTGGPQVASRCPDPLSGSACSHSPGRLQARRLVELCLAQPHGAGGDLDALILAQKLQRLIE